MDKKTDLVVALSGGFDPPHDGHIDMISDASKIGRVHIYLNSDEWLMRKKGYVFMPFIVRSKILMAMKGVELVVPVVDKDDTVCETIRMFKPDVFCNGGDRGPSNTPESKVCEELGIEMKFCVGGGKENSSSAIVKEAVDAFIANRNQMVREW